MRGRRLRSISAPLPFPSAAMAATNDDTPEAPTGLHVYTSATPSGYRSTILLAELGLPYTLQTVRRRMEQALARVKDQACKPGNTH